MDYQEKESYEYPHRTPEQPLNDGMPKQSPNNMATASLVMGILAMVTFCCCYGGLFFGGLGILFALLSRTEERMRDSAKAGLILSSIALTLMVLLFAGILAFAWLSNGWIEAPIQNLPVYPDVPELINPDNVLFRIGKGGVLL